MKTTGTLKTKMDEGLFSSALIIVVLFILPAFGATAMVVGSAIGLVAQVVLFPDRFRTRTGSLTPAIFLAVVFGFEAAVILAAWLIKGT